MTHAVVPGAEAWSHVAADGAPGALCLHGFTGHPGSMRGIAEAYAAAGFHVELPRLPGHGTHVDDMLETGWPDWTGEADAAYRRLAARTDRVVVAGQSMGGSLALWVAAQHPEVAALVLVNPATQPQPADVVEMLEDFVEDGMEVMPGVGSDIADPSGTDTAYEGTPIRPLLSLLDGLADLAPRYPELTMPLLLLNSPQDHVVDPAQSEHLATQIGGPVERVTLERSYHVATLDYDKDLVVEQAVAFGRRVAGSPAPERA